jgi:hypothetical protein
VTASRAGSGTSSHTSCEQPVRAGERAPAGPGSERHASEARISISAVVAGGSGGSPYVAA